MFCVCYINTEPMFVLIWNDNDVHVGTSDFRPKAGESATGYTVTVNRG